MKFTDYLTEGIIGSGIADIYMGKFRDKLGIIVSTGATEVYVAKDIEDAIKHYGNKTPPVIIEKGQWDVLWAFPVDEDGEIIRGMFSGAFIYSSNGIVMKGYHHPIRLMDRNE